MAITAWERGTKVAYSCDHNLGTTERPLLSFILTFLVAVQTTAPQQDARTRVVDAIIAEPYSETNWLALKTWAKENHASVSTPTIDRPDFKTHNSALTPDPEMPTDPASGHSAWIVYETCRVKHGATSLSQSATTGYHHSLAEESECLRATAAELRTRIIDGTLLQSSLDPSLQTLMALDKRGLLECWILLSASDPGLREDYPAYRNEHRQKLADYVNRYILKAAPPAIP